jgi:hypothetical protein
MSEVKRWYANWSDSMDEAPETDAPNEHGTMFIKLADHDRIVSEQVKTITELQNENRRLVEGTQDDAEFAHRRRRKRLAGYRRALSRCRGKRDNLRAENAELRRRAEHAEAVKPTRPDTREFSTTQGYLAEMERWATHLEDENRRFRGVGERCLTEALSHGRR